MAGVMRIFLVYPTFAVYRQVVLTVQLFEMLHHGEGMLSQSKRKKFFWNVLIAIFAWQWCYDVFMFIHLSFLIFGLPGEYMAPTLTGISVLCLANQKWVWFTRVFGGAVGNEGLGAFSLCFDWAYVGTGGSSIGSMFTPLATQLDANDLHSNSWSLTGLQNFPQLLYENGTEYDQLSILNGAPDHLSNRNIITLAADDFTLNYDRLAIQGLPWYAASRLLYKVSRTIFIGAGLTHFLLWHGKRVYNLIRAGREGIDDPHFKKMKAYPGETLHVASCTNTSTTVMSGAAKLLNALLGGHVGSRNRDYPFMQTSKGILEQKKNT
ncbi:hypothetical protein DFH08DRAFT_971974 [Mycena albidolilacea]|uniref:Uncharacterized protein n=1 Tax=Mycena albidolilacea TaxID=1033008 RepID=A0AAD6ZCQ9_9AGAR|nr:hypothetical protein DFH08DRAFT_971974 [Mycena albidolilacea]